MNEQQSIGNYHFLRLLGQSGFSTVYLGEHVQHHAPVAIKLLHGLDEESDGPAFLENTARIAQLHHPHIVPIVDFGIVDATAFIAMNYAPGGNLRDRYPRGTRIPLPTVLTYVKQIASALQYVHEQGLVHRDIKPHNLLLDADDSVLLGDFGTAAFSCSLDPQQHYDFEGTVLYAAPEQLHGKPQRSSDQYALAVMIYEWLSGDRLFSGTFHEVAHQHLFVAPPPFAEKAVSCPANIEQVILRALEKIPEKRFHSIKLFADELDWAYKVAQGRGLLPRDDDQTSRSVAPKRQFKSPTSFAS